MSDGALLFEPEEWVEVVLQPGIGADRSLYGYVKAYTGAGLRMVVPAAGDLTVVIPWQAIKMVFVLPGDDDLDEGEWFDDMVKSWLAGKTLEQAAAEYETGNTDVSSEADAREGAESEVAP